MHDDGSGSRVALLMATTVLAAMIATVAPAAAQDVRGRIIDSATGRGVALAGVYLLGPERRPVSRVLADTLGRYELPVPATGEFTIVAQRFGYFDTESPLLALDVGVGYDGLELELRPEPLAVEGLDVTVRNTEAIDFLRGELGVNPASIPGFRMVQGQRLEAAKLQGGNDPTNTLRALYVPIWHVSECVRINALPRPERLTWRGTPSALGNDIQAMSTPGVGGAAAEDSAGEGCGTLFLDDRKVPNDLLDTIDMRNVAVMLAWFGTVRLYTYRYAGNFRGR